MTVYIITQHEHEDYCGIGGVWFHTEVYNDKTVAEKRFNELRVEANRKNSGLYFDIESVELDKKQN